MRKFELYQDRLGRLYSGTITKSITFQVTEDCNLRCSYCYQINKSKKSMNFETAKKFIDGLLENGKGYREYLNDMKTTGYMFEFIGGEPFLEVGLMDKICSYIIDRMIELRHPLLPYTRFVISSNGTLYFEPKVQDFLNKFKDFISLSISIDGNKELHDSCRLFPNGKGSYDIAIKAAKDWIAKGNYMGSKMTICPENVDKVSKAVISLIKEGYENVNLNCVYEEGWKLKHARVLYYELKELADYIIGNKLDVTISMFNKDFYSPMKETENDNWCGGNGQMIAVDYKGDIFPCVRYMSSSLGKDREPLIIGNVDKGILQTKKERDINKCLKCITRRSQSTSKCFNCEVARGCSWCTAYNYQVTGNPNIRMTYICIMHKALSLANVYYWNKRKEYFKMYLQPTEAIRIIGKNEYDMLEKLEKENKKC